MNYKKGFFRIWLVINVIWVFLITLGAFPSASFKTLRVLGFSRMEYKEKADIKLINCILLTSKKREEDSPSDENHKLEISKALEYAQSIGISEDELSNTKIEEKDCNEIGYKSISDLQNIPATKDLIFERNNRVEHAKSNIFNFLWLLISVPLGLLLLGIATCYVSAGFKQK